MAKERLVKEWLAHKLRCVAWLDEENVLHAAAIRNGEPQVTMAMPRGTAVERIVESLEASLDVSNLRLNEVDQTVVHDVLLVLPHQESEGEALARRIELADDLELLPSTRALEEQVLWACDARGKNAFFAADLRGPAVFVLSRRRAAETPSLGWDEDQRIQTAVALSRIIRPTPINLRYAARIIGRFSSGIFAIRPAEIRGHGAQAAVMNPADAWLRDTELLELRSLLASWDTTPFDDSSKRWMRALWHFEYAMQTSYFHLRWPLIALAFEGLISTSTRGARRQFTTRLIGMRDLLGLSPVSQSDANDVWKHRSDVVHGGVLPDAREEAGRLYAVLEETLRAAIRRAIVDLSFRKSFVDPKAICRLLPVMRAEPRVTLCPSCGTQVSVGLSAASD